MENKEFKQLFNDIAKKHGFESSFGGWFRDSNESIVALSLQKSSFGNYYQLNIKIYFQGAFDRHYSKNKDLLNKDIGNIDRGEPKEYESFLILDQRMDDSVRKKGLEALFNNFLVPFTDKALTKKGLNELAKKGEIYLTPAIMEELSRLTK